MLSRYNFRLLKIEMEQSTKAQRLLMDLQREITIKNIVVEKGTIRFYIARANLPLLRRIRKRYKVKLKITATDQTQLFYFDSWTVFSLLIFVLIPLILSAFIWSVSVENATPEMEDNIMDTLHKQFHLKPALSIRQLPKAYEIRQHILSNNPELSWVFVERNGSKLTLKLQSAPKVERKPEKPTAGHLIARTSGVVTHWDIVRGERLFTKNMTVFKGDVIVSGIVRFNDQERVVGAEGEVYVDYWIETDFSVPRTIYYESVVPVGWKLYDINISEALAKKINTFDNLDEFIKIEKVTKTTKHEVTLNEDTIDTYLLPILEQKLLSNSPANTVIKSQKIWDVDVLDDTVKGQVLFLMNENIAQYQPFLQGDD